MDNPISVDLGRVAQDLQIRRVQVESVVQLLDEGNTVPFITRYRKERTGNLNEVVIREIQLRVQRLRELAERKETILKAIEAQGKLSDELAAAIRGAENPKRLEDLYLPFKPKKRTKASDARDKGLEPLAVRVWNRDDTLTDLHAAAQEFVNPEKGLETTEKVLEGVGHILSEAISEMAAVRDAVRKVVWKTGKIVTSKGDVPEGQGLEYRDYFDYSEPLSQVPPHRVLAINRGDKEGPLKIRFEVSRPELEAAFFQQIPLEGHPQAELFRVAAMDAMDRLILPSMEREARRDLTDAAERHAVDVFARNLRSLLLQPPIPKQSVLAIDPGLRSGCKVAVLDPQGNLLDQIVIYPHAPQNRRSEAKLVLKDLVGKHQVGVVAIGNGTACRETEELIAEIITEGIHFSQGGAGVATPGEVAFQVSEETTEAIVEASPEGRSEPPHHEAVPEPTAEHPGLAPDAGQEGHGHQAPEPHLHERATVHDGQRETGGNFHGSAHDLEPRPSETPAACGEETLPPITGGAPDHDHEPATSDEAPAPVTAAPEHAMTSEGGGPESVADHGNHHEHGHAHAHGQAEVHSTEVHHVHDHPTEVHHALAGAGVSNHEPGPPPEHHPEDEHASEPVSDHTGSEGHGHGAESAAMAEASPPPSEGGSTAGESPSPVAATAGKPGGEGRRGSGRHDHGRSRGSRSRPASSSPPPPQTPPAPHAADTLLAQLAYVIVNEAGASVYSTSQVGREELPEFDATLRSAISIGRRLQDPLSELVKIEPQNIGVGLYQHDVNPKQLKETLDSVISSCVNFVGVDLNTASVPLLRHVSGLNSLTARRIVDFRKEKGRFSNREGLMQVEGVGPATFTQAAGFLKLQDSPDPLDRTWVHPESYAAATGLLEKFGFTTEVVRQKDRLPELHAQLAEANPADLSRELGVGEFTLRDIIEALGRPERDPRDDLPKPIFKKGILKIEDLVSGMELKGTVLNVVDFGAFVDIGLKDSGLVHISQLANRYIKSPHDVVSVGDVVTIWVMSVDQERKRVSLTMVKPGTERQRGGGQGGPRRGQGGNEPREGQGPGRRDRSRAPRPSGSALTSPPVGAAPITAIHDAGPRRSDRGEAPGAPGHGGPDAGGGHGPGPGPGPGPGRGHFAPGGRPGPGPGRGGPRGGPFSGPGRPGPGGRPDMRPQPPRGPSRPSRPSPPPPPLSKEALSGTVPLRTFGQLKQLWQAREDPDDEMAPPIGQPGQPLAHEPEPGPGLSVHVPEGSPTHHDTHQPPLSDQAAPAEESNLGTTDAP